MYLPTVALLLAASGVKATAVLAQRAPSSNLLGRDIVQGWSVQSPATPSGTTSCGNGAYCPSSLHCNVAANDEVAACCTSSSDCRGDVEGAPKCADSSWNLFVGYMANGFCCESGMVGAYDTSKTVAGTCVASGDVGSLQTAVLTSSGTGAASTSAASSSSSASSASVTSSAASANSSSESSSKSESSKSTSSEASAKTTATSTGATSTGSSSTGSSTSSSPSATATGNGAEKVGMGFGLMGAAFLAAAAL